MWNLLNLLVLEGNQNFKRIWKFSNRDMKVTTCNYLATPSFFTIPTRARRNLIKN